MDAQYLFVQADWSTAESMTFSEIRIVECRIGNCKLDNLLNQIFSDLYCTDTPDFTSTTGYTSYDWNNESIPSSVITFKCPLGQAFDGKPMENPCAIHDRDNSNVYHWRYNDERDNLPDCVGRCCINPY